MGARKSYLILFIIVRKFGSVKTFFNNYRVGKVGNYKLIVIFFSRFFNDLKRILILI